MSSFWRAEDKIPVRQTKVSVPAENGLDYSDGQTIHVHLPPTIDFIQPRECYLRADVLIDNDSAKTRLCLDKMGGNCLIRDIRIYSGGAGGVLLEEIQGYNVMASLKYSYEQNESLRNKRELTEGGQNYSSKCRGSKPGTKAEINNVADSLYANTYADDTTSQSTEHAPQKVKMLIPLQTGIFQNGKGFPTMLTQGLRIEILLEDAPRVVRQLDAVSLTRYLGNNVMFHSVDGIDDNIAGAGRWTGTNNTTKIFVRRGNAQHTASNFPFTVGEYFDLVDSRKIIHGSGSDLTNAMATYTATNDALQVVSIKHYAPSDSASVGGEFGLTEITLQEGGATKTATNSENVTGVGGHWILVSRGVAKQGSAWKPTYTLSDVGMVIQQLEMPQGYTQRLVSMMKEGGVLNYGFLSYTNYRHSQLSSDTVANIRVPLQESKCKSVLAVPTDSTSYSNTQLVCGYTMAVPDGATADYPAYASGDFTDNTNTEQSHDKSVFSNRSGLVGIWDHLSQYQWYYDGRLNPSRKVDTSQVAQGKSISQQWNIESEKALAMGGIRPLSFRDCHTNAFIGRAVALQDGVYDARNKDFVLQVEYNYRTSAGASKPPVKNKLWQIFSCHLRTIMVKGDQISVQV